MTSLQVICGLGPPIKNPGYVYARYCSLFFKNILLHKNCRGVEELLSKNVQ